jgi:putative FmdB family regulatory protein
MPIYEYRCESCADSFEVLTSFAERDRAQACPACSSTRTKVLVSTFATTGQADAMTADMDFSSAGGGCCGGGCGSCGCSVN